MMQLKFYHIFITVFFIISCTTTSNVPNLIKPEKHVHVKYDVKASISDFKYNLDKLETKYGNILVDDNEKLGYLSIIINNNYREDFASWEIEDFKVLLLDEDNNYIVQNIIPYESHFNDNKLNVRADSQKEIEFYFIYPSNYYPAAINFNPDRTLSFLPEDNPNYNSIKYSLEKYGNTQALFLLAEKMSYKIIKPTINKYEIPVDVKDENGVALIFYALNGNNIRVVEGLIEDGVDLSVTMLINENTIEIQPLHYAILNMQKDIINLFIENNISLTESLDGFISPVDFCKQYGLNEHLNFLNKEFNIEL